MGKWKSNLRGLLGMSGKNESDQTGIENENTGQHGNSDPAGNGNGGSNSGGGTGNSETGNSNGDNAGGSEGNDSGSNGATSNDSGFEFDGEFDPKRAGELITKLRNENRELAKIAKAAASKSSTNHEGEGGQPKENQESEAAKALEEVMRLRAEMMETRQEAKFREVASSMNIRPNAMSMAWEAVRSEIVTDDSGNMTNLTTALQGLQERADFMFIPKTQGQRGTGSAGGSSDNSSGEGLLDVEAAKIAKSFGMTPEQYLAHKTGKRPVAGK